MVIALLDEFDDDRDRMLTYIALGRANAHLIVIAPNQIITALKPSTN